jgi:poly(hydroxyalkanoate) granule-associated protein
MVTKKTDVKLAKAVADSGRQIWLAGLGAFAKAQEEGGKVFDLLVQRGKELEVRTREFAGGGVHELASRATGTIDKLEQVFEGRVARALKRLGVPSAKEVEHLSKRVAQLNAQVEALVQKHPRAAVKRMPKLRKAA